MGEDPTTARPLRIRDQMRRKERLSIHSLPQNGPPKALAIGILGLLPRGQAIPNPTQLFARGYTQDLPASKVGPNQAPAMVTVRNRDTGSHRWCLVPIPQKGGVGPSRHIPAQKKENKKRYISTRRPSDIMVGKTGKTTGVIRGLNSGKGLR